MRLVFRANATVELGTGHVMRLIALAEALKRRGGEPLFALGRPTVAGPILDSRGLEHVEVGPGPEELAALIATRHAGAAVVDGYDFDAHWFASLASATRVPVAFVDDLGAVAFGGALLVNPNFRAESRPHRARKGTRLLLGSDYAMLRSEILSCREQRVLRHGTLRLLVTFGGADHLGMTRRILAASAGLELGIVAVAGAANPSRGGLEALAAADPRVELLSAVPDMGAVLARVDAAATAAGQTLWELAYAGVPALAWAVADNQLPAVEALARERLIVYGGPAETTDDGSIRAALRAFVADETGRAEMARRTAAIVDGRGAERVLDSIEEIAR